MIQTIEILLLLFLSFNCFRIANRTSTDTFVRLTSLTILLLLSTLIFVGAHHISRISTPNPLAGFITGIIAATLTFFSTKVFFEARWQKYFRNLFKTQNLFASLSVIPEYSIRAFFVFVYLTVFSILLIFLVPLLSKYETVGRQLQTDSLWLHFFIATQNTKTESVTIPEEPKDSSLHPQLIDAIAYRLENARNFLDEKTGSKQLRETMDAIQFLLNLSPLEQQRLLQANPEIKKLIEYPSLNAIISNDKILDLVHKIADGSVTALYQLGEIKEIQDLSSDHEFSSLVRSIDVLQLRLSVEHWRQETREQNQIPVDWQQSSIQNSLSFKPTLSNPTLWKTTSENQTLFQWNSDQKIGLLKGKLHEHNCLSSQLVLSIKANTQVLVWLDGKQWHPNQSHNNKSMFTSIPSSTIEVVCMVIFNNHSTERHCEIDISCP